MKEPYNGVQEEARAVADLTMGLVEETLSHFRQMLASDGGRLVVLSYDEPTQRLTIRYEKGTNEDCPECVISHEHLELFIKEALDARKCDVREVKVMP
jgi:Fe-S cluster biogenesis protein NfuA